jgi:hypothetical protein
MQPRSGVPTPKRLPAVLYSSESGDGLRLRDLYKDLNLILRERESQRLPAVLYGGESSDSLRLRDLCKDLIFCEHSNLRGYLPSCMGVRAVTASVSVISVRISSSRKHADLRGYLLSCVEVRAVTASVSVISVRISSSPNMRILDVTFRPVCESESSDGFRFCDLCEDLILREHWDLRGYLPSCMGVRAVTASVSLISARISSSANTRTLEFTCRPVWG